MEKISIKSFVDSSNKVYFQFYRSGFFYYSVKQIKSSDYYQFSVPQDDIGNATLLKEDKAITFMRWIRKSIESNELVKIG